MNVVFREWSLTIRYTKWGVISVGKVILAIIIGALKWERWNSDFWKRNKIIDYAGFVNEVFFLVNKVWFMVIAIWICEIELAKWWARTEEKVISMFRGSKCILQLQPWFLRQNVLQNLFMVAFGICCKYECTSMVAASSFPCRASMTRIPLLRTWCMEMG